MVGPIIEAKDNNNYGMGTGMHLEKARLREQGINFADDTQIEFLS